MTLPLSDMQPSYNVPGGLSVVSTQVLHIGRKALVQPQVIPPLQSYQVAKPLKKIKKDNTARIKTSATHSQGTDVSLADVSANTNT